jgi:hypothetical protein
MHETSHLATAGRHIGSVGLQALLIAAIIVSATVALSAIYRPATNFLSTGTVLAAKPQSGAISVQLPVAHGETTVATVNPGGADVYVRLRCYAPDLGGAFVYGRYFPVDSSHQATLGPLASTLWTSGGATCIAEEGYFTRNGLGKWVISATTTFAVDS